MDRRLYLVRWPFAPTIKASLLVIFYWQRKSRPSPQGEPAIDRGSRCGTKIMVSAE